MPIPGQAIMDQRFASEIDKNLASSGADGHEGIVHDLHRSRLERAELTDADGAEQEVERWDGMS